jgi:hypothetical protein
MITMGKISISLECNSIEEAKALLNFLAGYRREQKKEEIDTAMAELKTVSENPVSEPVTPKPVEVDDKLVTAEGLSRFAVSLLRQGKGAEIKRLLGEYNAKAFTDLPKDKMAEFLHILQRI